MQSSNFVKTIFDHRIYNAESRSKNRFSDTDFNYLAFGNNYVLIQKSPDIRRDNNNVDSIEVGRIVIVNSPPCLKCQENCYVRYR